jgi:5-methylcytosine-specific restriction endonuclease McrA
MKQKIISREEARAQGLVRFFTGKRCAQGHRASRYVSTSACSVCDRVRARLRRAADPEKHRESVRRWHQENPEKVRAAARRWQRANPDRFAAILGKKTALRRNPNCVPESFRIKDTVAFYAKARRLTRETGIPHHVDHIIPLKAGGLHCASNLQVLTAAENLRKSKAEDQELIEAYRAQQEQTELQTA